MIEVIRTIHSCPQKWACGAAGSALPWHGRGRRFDPDQVHQISPKKLSGVPFIRQHHSYTVGLFNRGPKTLDSGSHCRQRLFLLSPANLSGIRAGYLLRENAQSDLASRLRTSGATLGELFSFVSGLYFRGKLAYARSFSSPSSGLPGALVITAGSGLLSPETIVSFEQVKEWTTTDIAAGHARYRAPLDRDCHSLFEKAGEHSDIVLLGSIATSKYVDPLLQVFGVRLLFPAEFVGRGDMSRGGLMLRAVEAQQELAYIPVLNATRRGSRPPKLLPLRPRPRPTPSKTSPPERG